MKIFLINDTITFIPEKRQISSLKDSTLTFSISSAAARCLATLIEKRPAVLTKEQILDIGWREHGLVVTENSVHQAITSLRKIFKEAGLEGDLIQTQPRVGYQISDSFRIIVSDAHENTESHEGEHKTEMLAADPPLPTVKTSAFTFTLIIKSFVVLILFTVNISLWTSAFFSTSFNRVTPWFFFNSEDVSYEKLQTELSLNVYIAKNGSYSKALIETLTGELSQNENLASVINKNSDIKFVYINGTYTDKALSYFLCSGEISAPSTMCYSYVVLKEAK
ncbi:winged helix-turn-helix domain-containing protein [Enterobacter cloacae]